MPTAWLVTNAPDHVLLYVARLVGAKQGATPEEIEIMRHALGDNGHATPGWRNYYCESADDSLLLSMVERGLMIAGATLNEGRDRYYAVSPKWVEALGIRIRA